MSTEFLLESSIDGTTRVPLRDTRGTGEDVPHDFVDPAEPVAARYVRVTGYGMPYGSGFAVSGLRVFGKGTGQAPGDAAPTAVRKGPLTTRVAWGAVRGAHGYNMRYGRTPQKLYHSWMVYKQAQLRLTGLNAGVDYFVAVDAFNENGVTEGKPVPVEAPAR